MFLIKLTRKDGSVFALNPEFIVKINERDGDVKSDVMINSGTDFNNWVSVKETIDEIIGKINMGSIGLNFPVAPFNPNVPPNYDWFKPTVTPYIPQSPYGTQFPQIICQTESKDAAKIG